MYALCGKMLKTRRKRLELTQEDLSVALDGVLSARQIGDYERNGFPKTFAKKK